MPSSPTYLIRAITKPEIKGTITFSFFGPRVTGHGEVTGTGGETVTVETEPSSSESFRGIANWVLGYLHDSAMSEQNVDLKFEIYDTIEPEPEPEPEIEPQDTSNKDNIKDNNNKLRNNETDVKETIPVNIEDSEAVSQESKKEMIKKSEKNDEVVSDAKPKLIIRIPKPLASGYIVIDLGGLLSGLLKGLAAAVVTMVLSKVVEGISDALSDNQNGTSGGSDDVSGYSDETQLILKNAEIDINQDDIDVAIDSLDIETIILDSELEYNNSLNDIPDNSIITPTSSDEDVKIIDNYYKPNKNKSKDEKYTIDKRNREDILESNIVTNRNGTSNKNIETVNNPNYGVYLD